MISALRSYVRWSAGVVAFLGLIVWLAPANRRPGTGDPIRGLAGTPAARAGADANASGGRPLSPPGAARGEGPADSRAPLRPGESPEAGPDAPEGSHPPHDERSRGGEPPAPAGAGAGAPPTGSPAAEARTEGETVTGQVFDGATRMGIPEARVRFRPAEGENGAPGEPFRAVTDPGGAFTLGGLAPGTYRVVARAEGYAESADRSVNVTANSTAPIAIVLWRAAAIEGTVVDARSGAPIPGATVFVAERAAGRPMPLLMETPAIIRRLVPEGRFTDTDDRGAFRLEAVPPGWAHIRALHPAYVAGALTIEVAPGAALQGIEIPLGGGGAVRGLVLGVDGRPIEGALVGATGASLFRTARTGPDGRFEVAGLPAGSYAVRLMESRHQTIQSIHVELLAGETREVTIREEARVTVSGVVTRAGQPLLDVRVRLQGGSSLGPTREARTDAAGRYAVADVPPGTYAVAAAGRPMGTVAIPAGVREHLLDLALPGGTVAGTVGDAATGLPVANALVRVWAEDPDEGSLAGRVAQGRTAADGSYRLEGLGSGPHRVAVAAAGYAQAERSGVLSDAGAVDFALTGGAIISGTVRGPDGAPVSGALFRIERAETGTPSLANPIRPRSDGQGGYRFPPLEPGAYRITAGAADLACRTLVVDLPAEGAQVDFHLPAGATLHVTVVDAVGAPVPDAVVTPTHRDGERLRLPALALGDTGTGPTDAAGQFVRGLLPPGSYRIDVTHPAHAGASVESELVDEETTRLEILLTP